MLCTIVVMLVAVGWAQAQTASAGPTKNDPQNLLDQFSGAVESMVRRVSPAVVQVLATTYSLGNEGARSNVNSGVEQRVASGVIVAADGYIMTNAHVVEDAHTIRVRLVSANPKAIGDVLAQSFAPTVDAVLVGTYNEADLALLKIEAQSLPTLRFARVGSVRQGQVVFAFGSPNSLQNSVTMGIVSSIARQLDPDDPCSTFRQTRPSIPATAAARS